MPPPMESHVDILQTSLRTAHENERRWLEMSPEFSFDSERMEQWSSTARLRRQEVVRIETLLAQMEEPSSSAQPGIPPPAF